MRKKRKPCGSLFPGIGFKVSEDEEIEYRRAIREAREYIEGKFTAGPRGPISPVKRVIEANSGEKMASEKFRTSNKA